MFYYKLMCFKILEMNNSFEINSDHYLSIPDDN